MKETAGTAGNEKLTYWADQSTVDSEFFQVSGTCCMGTCKADACVSVHSEFDRLSASSAVLRMKHHGNRNLKKNVKCASARRV